MFLLSDIITYVRRIVKTPSNEALSDNLIIDYINRFWINDVDARIQLFDLKTKYQFQTYPGVDQYNMPLYDVQTEPGNQTIGLYPVYQGFEGPCFINGIPASFYTRRDQFFGLWPNVVQNQTNVATGDGTDNYTINLPILPNSAAPQNPPYNGILRGHVDTAGIIASGTNQDPPISTNLNTAIPSTSIYPMVYITALDAAGNNMVISDSGQFLTSDINYGLLMQQGTAPFGYGNYNGSYTTTTNTVNYLTGVANVTFPANVPSGNNISAQVYYFESGLSRAVLFYNNVLTLRPPPDRSYLVELDAYLTPAAFLSTSQAVPYGYMSEYIARGAARKLLSDTGDIEQFQFYEPLFKEQESLVWKRSQRQNTATRVPTIYSQGPYLGYGFNNLGAGSL